MSRVGGVPGVLLAALALVGLLAGAAAAAGLPQAPEEERVRTADGWELPLLRYPASPGAPRHHAIPVVLVHGTGVNRMNWMATPRHDLAAYLSRRGFEVYVPELRGSRASVPPERSGLRAGDWDFDTHLRRDLPALLARVGRRTGSRSVYYVGHSLGGILGYVYAAEEDPEGIAGIVALGSPTRIDPLGGAQAGAEKRRGMAPRRGRLDAPGLVRFVLPFLTNPGVRLAHLLSNPENVDGEVVRAVLRDGLEPVASGLLRQYIRWVGAAEITDRHGRGYRERLERIACPALLVAGRADAVVPAWQVRSAYEDLSAADRTWLVLGRAWGFSADYGHADMVIGRAAPDEVFPRIGDWLEDRERERCRERAPWAGNGE
ncbi:alpha/beta hydrolase [Myxococcota bacterium]|nr:alpha/beta hydrolase [Myxococcota bacterium]